VETVHDLEMNGIFRFGKRGKTHFKTEEKSWESELELGKKNLFSEVGASNYEGEGVPCSKVGREAQEEWDDLSRNC